MRLTTVLIITASLAVTACSSLPETVTSNTSPGYRHYDPCIRCGESWVSVPNQEFAALRESRKRNAIHRQDMELMYGPNWRERWPALAEKYAD